MPTDTAFGTRYLELLVESLDIPKSLYDRARARHRSLADWLCRPESRLVRFKPHVSPQGSFRFGTVVRPLFVSHEYDLDNVTTLVMSKAAITQQELKRLYGLEVQDYAKAHGMLEDAEDKNRCWRLPYADEVKFHLDTLPSIAEEQAVIFALTSRSVSPELAARAIAITDKRHPEYAQITERWFSSNPRGFARWFESRLRPFAETRMRQLVQLRAYATVEDVPAYEWKTTLQRSIQLLKRHRDVMFRDNPDVAPISMIITNLAAHAYEGESDLWTALRGIVERMPRYVNRTRPWVPNPADPAEDYADKWASDPDLERNFWNWHAQVSRDVQRLPTLTDARMLTTDTKDAFRVDLSDRELKTLGLTTSVAAPSVRSTAPIVSVGSTAPRPWGRGGRR